MMYNMVTRFKKLFFMLQKSPLPTTKNSFQNDDEETLLRIWRTTDGQRASELRSQDNIWKRIKSKSILEF